MRTATYKLATLMALIDTSSAHTWAGYRRSERLDIGLRATVDVKSPRPLGKFPGDIE